MPRCLNVRLSWWPPELSDTDLRSYFDDRPSLQRRAYYRAANLIASEQAEVRITGRGMSSWIAIGRAQSLLLHWMTIQISIRNGKGRYPPELRRAGYVIILLTVDEENRTKRMQERGVSHH